MPENSSHILSPEEIERYKRHLVLKEVGGQGQQKLKAARVLIVGAGGLGSPLLMYLAAAGVGTIGIVDDDTVTLDNLQRQIAHDTSRVGDAKVASAREAARAPQPARQRSRRSKRGSMRPTRSSSSPATTSWRTAPTTPRRATSSPMPAISPSARSSSARSARSTATSRPSNPTTRASDGTPYPSYRCLFPEAPPPGTVPNCAEVGVLGSVVGVIGTLQATEVLKEILGVGASLAGRLLIYDALGSRFETLTLAWDPDNPLTGRNPTITDLSVHAGAAKRARRALPDPASPTAIDTSPAKTASPMPAAGRSLAARAAHGPARTTGRARALLPAAVAGAAGRAARRSSAPSPSPPTARSPRRGSPPPRRRSRPRSSASAPSSSAASARS